MQAHGTCRSQMPDKFALQLYLLICDCKLLSEHVFLTALIQLTGLGERIIQRLSSGTVLTKISKFRRLGIVYFCFLVISYR